MLASGGRDREPPFGAVIAFEMIAKILAIVVVAAIVLVVILLLADTTARHLYGQPIAGVFDYVTGIQVVLIFGAALAVGSGRMTGSRMRLLGERPEAAISLLFILFLAIHTVGWIVFGLFEQMQSAYTLGERSIGIAAYPIWPKYLVLILGMCVLGLLLISEFLRAIQCLASGSWPWRDPGIWENATDRGDDWP